jgi:hypothetical protein
MENEKRIFKKKKMASEKSRENHPKKNTLSVSGRTKIQPEAGAKQEAEAEAR